MIHKYHVYIFPKGKQSKIHMTKFVLARSQRRLSMITQIIEGQGWYSSRLIQLTLGRSQMPMMTMTVRSSRSVKAISLVDSEVRPQCSPELDSPPSFFIMSHEKSWLSRSIPSRFYHSPPGLEHALSSAHPCVFHCTPLKSRDGVSPFAPGQRFLFQ